MKKYILFLTGILGLSLSAVFAQVQKIQMIDASGYPSDTGITQHIDANLNKLLKNPAFLKMWQMLEQSKLNYKILVVGPALGSQLKLKQYAMGNNQYFGGLFMTPKASADTFKNNPTSKLANEVAGHPLIVYNIFPYVREGQKMLAPPSISTMVQEIFHAYQYEFYTQKKNNVALFEDTKKYIKHLEVEGDLATIAFIDFFEGDTYNHKFELFKKIPNSKDLHGFLKNTCYLTHDNLDEIDEAINDVWTDVLGQSGESLKPEFAEGNNLRLSILRLKALESLFGPFKLKD